MRKKEEQLIITFHTTAEAMAVDKLCRESAIGGRMIPVPRELSSGCGLAWCGPKEKKDELEQWMREQKLEYEQMAIMMY